MSWMNLQPDIVTEFAVLAPTPWQLVLAALRAHSGRPREFGFRQSFERRETKWEAEHNQTCVAISTKTTLERCRRLALTNSVFCGAHVTRFTGAYAPRGQQQPRGV